MEKILKVEIEKKGYVKGTVGWLCQESASVKIGETENGRQGAWLKDKAGNTMGTLAIREWENYSEEIKLFGSSGQPEEDVFGFACSDACWKKTKEIQTEAVKIMDELWKSEKGGVDLKIDRE